MLPAVLGLLLVAVVAAQRQAVTVLVGSVSGTITFKEESGGIRVTGTVSGLTEGDHGFHIHSQGDLTNGCTSTGSHFNPHNENHGGRLDSTRHVGDLGNINANSTGIASIDFVDSVISLSGQHNIIGRAVVVHADPDDNGQGGFNDSLTTGHAGARLACGVIGIVADTNASSIPTAFLTAVILSMVVIVQNIF